MGQRKIPFYMQIGLFGVAAGALVMASQNMPEFIKNSKPDSYQVASAQAFGSCTEPGLSNIAGNSMLLEPNPIFCITN